jgi:hypothetical protein
MAIDVSAE